MSLTLTSTSYDGRYLQLVCTQTIDIATNTSAISWTLSSLGGNDNYYGTGPTSVYINGTQVYYMGRTSWQTKQFPAAKGSVSGVLNVHHADDGSKSISVSLSTAIYTSTVSTASSNWTLESIPRAATLSSATDFNDEGNPTITYSNPAGNSASSLDAFIYAADDTTLLVDAKALTKNGSSYTFSLSENEREVLRKATPNSNSMTIKFYIRVILPGDIVFWSNPLDRTFSIVNAAPTASITYYDSNDKTYALTGNRNVFIKHRSHFAYSIDANPKKHATLTGYLVSLGSQSLWEASGTIYNIDGAGFAYTVTDSRGNTNGSPISAFSTIDYVPVTINKDISVFLEGETGATITIDLYGNYYDGSFGAVSNQLRLWYRYAEKGGDYTEWKEITSGIKISGNYYSATATVTDLSYDKAYIIECCAGDALEDYVYTEPYTSVLTPVFDWGQNSFNFNVPVSVKGIVQNHIVEQGTSGIWTYRKWADGAADCRGIHIQTSVQVTNAWGGLFESTGYAVDLPSDLFVETPQFTITLSGTNGVLLETYSEGNTTETPWMCVVRPNAITIDRVCTSIVAHGRWK